MYKFGLKDILSDLEITKNHLSRESKVRSGSVIDFENGNIKRVELSTLKSLLDTINTIATEKGINKTYGIEDIVKYEYAKGDDQK